MISSLEKTGDIRKADRALFHPMFFEVPCAFLLFTPEAVCAQLQQNERREFAYSFLNFQWLVFEHQMALPDPPWVHQEVITADRTDVLFPEAVRDLVPQLNAQPTTVEEFRKRQSAYAEANKRLFQERLKHDPVHQPAYRKNLASLEGPMNSAPEESDKMTEAMPKNTYAYHRVPFVIYIAKTQGKPKIVWFRLLSD